MKPLSRFLLVLAAIALGCVLLVAPGVASGGPGKSTGDPDEGGGYRGNGFRVVPAGVSETQGSLWRRGGFFWGWRPFGNRAARTHQLRGQTK